MFRDVSKTLKVMIFWIGTSQQTKPGYTISILRPKLCHPFGKPPIHHHRRRHRYRKVWVNTCSFSTWLGKEWSCNTGYQTARLVTAAYYSNVRIKFCACFGLRFVRLQCYFYNGQEACVPLFKHALFSFQVDEQTQEMSRHCWRLCSKSATIAGLKQRLTFLRRHTDLGVLWVPEPYVSVMAIKFLYFSISFWFS